MRRMIVQEEQNAIEWLVPKMDILDNIIDWVPPREDILDEIIEWYKHRPCPTVEAKGFIPSVIIVRKGEGKELEKQVYSMLYGAYYNYHHSYHDEQYEYGVYYLYKLSEDKISILNKDNIQYYDSDTVSRLSSYSNWKLSYMMHDYKAETKKAYEDKPITLAKSDEQLFEEKKARVQNVHPGLILSTAGRDEDFWKMCTHEQHLVYSYKRYIIDECTQCHFTKEEKELIRDMIMDAYVNKLGFLEPAIVRWCKNQLKSLMLN